MNDEKWRHDVARDSQRLKQAERNRRSLLGQTIFLGSLSVLFVVPLVAGAYWKRANTQGALFAAVGGLGAWLVATLFFPDAMVPANLTGFAASIVGMIAGTLMPEFIRNRGSSIEEAMARLAKHGRSEVN